MRKSQRMIEKHASKLMTHGVHRHHAHHIAKRAAGIHGDPQLDSQTEKEIAEHYGTPDVPAPDDINPMRQGA